MFSIVFAPRMNKFPRFRSQCVSLRVRVCVRVCELVAGIRGVMQDYPAGRLPTSAAEETARQRGWRAADGEMEEGHFRSLVTKLMWSNRRN